jgi:hypothetical protein
MQEKGLHPVDADALKVLSPYPWERINRLDDYLRNFPSSPFRHSNRRSISH